MKTALIVVDVQKDFCPGGALAVRDGDRVVAQANRLIDLFDGKGWPVYLTRDWHPQDHISFKGHGGPWPTHCVADTPGAEFHAALKIPTSARIVSKADRSDAYSVFDGTRLADWLDAQGVESLVTLGLATDYCVKATVMDALAVGFRVYVASDAIQAVDVQPGDGARAIDEMKRRGAEFRMVDEILEMLESSR